MTWTICWNPEYFYSTLLVSGLLIFKYIFYNPSKVKICLKLGNQPVTKRFNFLVGTSETTRPLSSTFQIYSTFKFYSTLASYGGILLPSFSVRDDNNSNNNSNNKDLRNKAWNE
jgi:hypothetical protein